MSISLPPTFEKKYRHATDRLSVMIESLKKLILSWNASNTDTSDTRMMMWDCETYNYLYLQPYTDLKCNLFLTTQI